MEIELGGLTFYARGAREIEEKDPDLASLFRELAEMEKEHSRRLKEELEKIENLHWLQSTVTC